MLYLFLTIFLVSFCRCENKDGGFICVAHSVYVLVVAYMRWIWSLCDGFVVFMIYM